MAKTLSLKHLSKITYIKLIYYIGASKSIGSKYIFNVTKQSVLREVCSFENDH